MMSVPEGASPLSTMFDTYAADQEKWYTDFVDVLEKMLDNGYDSGSLQVAPDHVTNVICPRQNPNDWRKFYNCYHDIEGDLQIFYITSKCYTLKDILFIINRYFCNTYDMEISM